MNSMYCEREPETVGAIRHGSCSADLLDHIAHCTACSEARHVAEALLPDAAFLQSTVDLRLATQVWENAQGKAQTFALKRASRVLVVLKAAGFIYATIFAVWSLRTFPVMKHYSILPVVNGEVASTYLAAVVIAATCIVSGLWYMLREDKRENTHSRPSLS
jgi:hypothetical protein